MNNGINFPGDGPIMDGTWQNLSTGDYFVVRDTYFQDGQLIVQATDGRTFDYNMIQNYVKVDRPLNVEKPAKQQNRKPVNDLSSEIAAEVLDDDMLDEDMALITGSKKSEGPAKDVAEITQKTQQAPIEEDEDFKFINRALSRVKTEPVFEHKITWKNFPSKQMEMLVDLLGVPVEKVSNYYIDKLSVEDIRELLRQSLTEFIEKQLDDEPVTETEPKKSKTEKKTTK